MEISFWARIDAHPCCRKVAKERWSELLRMASSLLLCSGLVILGGGTGMVRCGFRKCTEAGTVVILIFSIFEFL